MGLFSGITNAIKSVGSVLDPFGSLISGGLSYMGASSANAANAEEAQKNRDFQERMRSTQYQTAVEDLKKAGLNPMLAYQNGGAGNVSGAVSAPVQNALGQGVSSSLQARQNIAQVKNLDEQNQLIKDDALLKRQQALTEVNRSFRESQAASIDRERMDLDRYLGMSQARLQLSQARNYDTNSALAAQRTLLESYDLSGKRIDDWARRQPIGGYGRAIGTFFGDLGRVFSFGRK